MPHTAVNAAEPSAGQSRPSMLRLYADLTKIRLSVLVVVTASVGAIMASGPEIAWWLVLWTTIGTLLSATAANAINQVMEVRRDALMERTHDRPIPSGRLSAVHGWVVAVLLGYGGIFTLAIMVNFFAAGLALLTLLLYVLAYTPLKVLSSFNTLIGAIVGAIPPLIGWVAVRGTIDAGGLVLAALLFLWQLPHFLTLVWMYRDEYDQAGFRMLPSVAGGDRVIGEASLISALLLIPLALMMTSLKLTGVLYVAAAILVGLWFVWKCLVFYRNPSREHARSAFLTSLAYLPIVLLFMVLDRSPMPLQQPVMLTPATLDQP
ncbi:MAG: heme o synthase [Phycisphaerales bacterium]|nr:heme o synthase [Phycisphaerales bacterium]